MRFCSTIFFCVFAALSFAQIEKDSIDDEVSLLFIGDIMGHGPQIKGAYDEKSGTYDYHHCFKYIKDVISDADYAIGNLEVTLAGPPYKGYPQFSSPDALAVACKDAGMDVLVTSNNHTCDRGGDGIIRTVNTLDSLDIWHTGSFTDSLDRRRDHPLIIEENCIRIALLNYTYGTNGLSYPEPTIVNLLDKELIKKDMARAKSMNVDKIIVVTHWGSEYKLQPVKYQIDFADYIFDQGADIIVGSHPHVLEKMVWQKDTTKTGKEKLVVYSLGNFVSNQRKRYTDGGAMFKLTLQKKNDSCFIKEAGYYLTWVHRPKINDVYKYYVLPADKYEGDTTFFDHPEDMEKLQLFLDDSRKLYGDENINVSEYIYENKKWVLKE